MPLTSEALQVKPGISSLMRIFLDSSKVKLLYFWSRFKALIFIAPISVFLCGNFHTELSVSPQFLDIVLVFNTAAAAAAAATFSSSSRQSAELWNSWVPSGHPSSELPGWLQCFCLPLCTHILSRSRHRRRRRLSSGPPPPRSLSLWCWGLRSCRLNCQSLWTSLIGRGGWPSLGGWDTHTHRGEREACTRGSNITHTHTHRGGYEFMHDTFMNYLRACMCISHTQWGQDKDEQTTQTQQQGQRVSVTQG